MAIWTGYSDCVLSICGFWTSANNYVQNTKIDLEQEEKKDLEKIVKEKAVLSLLEIVADTNKKWKAWDMYYKVNERNIIPKKAMELYG